MACLLLSVISSMLHLGKFNTNYLDILGRRTWESFGRRKEEGVEETLSLMAGNNIL